MNGQELTTAQVAERLGVSVVTVRLWCRRGLFPNAYEQQTPRGAVWMIPESDLKGFEPPKKTGRPPKAKIEMDAKASKKNDSK
jgi:hypothetical protein